MKNERREKRGNRKNESRRHFNEKKFPSHFCLLITDKSHPLKRKNFLSRVIKNKITRRKNEKWEKNEKKEEKERKKKRKEEKKKEEKKRRMKRH